MQLQVGLGISKLHVSAGILLILPLVELGVFKITALTWTLRKSRMILFVGNPKIGRKEGNLQLP